MVTLPLVSLSDSNVSFSPVMATQDSIIGQAPDKSESYESFKVLLNDSSVAEVSADDYVFGVVAAEMPALYHEEALKAQAVAAYTFACYRKGQNTNAQYDISADPETAQCYITRDEAKDKWGDNADIYTKKIEACISEVKGQRLTFNGITILAAYHAISSGRTNACADVWGSDLAYLTQKDSLGDKLADGYLSEAVFTSEELIEKLQKIALPQDNNTNLFSNPVCTDTGYVKEIDYCGKTIRGSEISKALGLRSTNFEINFADQKYTFSVYGYGHGVGMSQNGANYMAKQGSTYEAILLHYYNGAILEKN